MMKSSDQDTTRAVIERLREYLADVSFCILEEGAAEAELEDLRLGWSGRLRIGHETRLLLIQTRTSGQPRLAREAVNQLLVYRGRLPQAYCVFGAPYVSESAGKIATDEGIGYVDLAGNCRICFDSVYICRAGWPNPVVERRGLRSLYSPKAERVLRVLLAEPKRSWRIEPLAADARVSLGMASKVKRLLEDREWLIRKADGFRLSQPDDLLAEWARSYRYGRNTVHDFYSLDPIPLIESKLAQACQDLRCNYALTGFSAAARMAPMVRYQRVTAYAAGRTDELARRMNLKRVTSGANVSLIEPYDEGVLFQAKEVDSIRIVSSVQAYLDVLNFRGRGEEAAEAILDEVIKPVW